MKVYILTHVSFPYGMAATQRILCYGRSLLAAGIDCEVLIYRRTELYGFSARNHAGSGEYASLPFRYIGNTPQRGSNLIIRQLMDFVDILNTGRFLKHNLNKGDVVLLYMSGQVKRMLRFMNIIHRAGAFCVRDFCEYPNVKGGETKKNLRLRQIVFSVQLPKLDGVICISDNLMKLASAHVSSACKLLKVPVMVDFDKYQMENKSNLAEKPYIFHSGTLTEQKDGILGIIEAFAIACRKKNLDIQLICTGNQCDSPHAAQIDNLVSKYDLQNRLLFTGYLTREVLNDYLAQASLVIINKYPTLQNEYCFSTKLAEYTAACKPLILTEMGEAVNYFENGKSALFVKPQDVTALSQAICWAFENPQEMKKMALVAQSVCKTSFDFRVWSEPLKTFFESLGN